ncbi:hypothetical protein [Nostoc sp. PCC 7524]|nr:hypothetical protein [Nostoc sp. PCC 7524]
MRKTPGFIRGYQHMPEFIQLSDVNQMANILRSPAVKACFLDLPRSTRSL